MERDLRMSVSVVIPSKLVNNLVRCVTAIRQKDASVQVVIVDDGLVLHPWPDVLYGTCIIKGKKPFCYSTNCNLGIQTALANPGCNGVILLNDDALVQTPGGLSALAGVGMCHSEVGVLSAVCNRVGNPNQMPDQQPTFRYDSRVLAFVCVYVPRSTVARVGLLDERFTAYGCEDVDYCRRVMNAELKLGISEICKVDHLSLPSSFRTTTNKKALLLEGRAIYYEKWGVQP